MAVVRIAAIHHYIGASGDTKPTTGVPAGSLFFEITSGTPNESREYIFDGSNWALKVTTTEALGA